MERLKKILRQALAEQVTRIKLQAGQPMEILTPQGPRLVPEDGPVDQEYLQKLYAFLFPAEKAALATGQTTKGALSVPNVGRIQLIAQPAPPASLRLYLPPGGQALFDSDWARLSHKTVAPGAPVPAPPAARAQAVAPQMPAMAPPRALPDMGGDDDGPGGFIPPMLAGGGVAPLVASRPSAAGAPPPPAAPAVVPGALSFDDDGGGFVPPGFAGGMAPAVSSRPAAAPGGGGGGQPGFGGGQPGGGGQAGFGGGAPQATAFVPPGSGNPAAFVPPTAPTRPAPQAFPEMDFANAPIVFQNNGGGGGGGAAPQAPPTIDFSANAGGDSTVSDGSNPIDAVLTDMIKRKASDLHCTCGEPLAFRVDGDIVRTTVMATPDLVEQFLAPIMPARNVAEFVKINDTDFAYEIRNVGRFRVNVFRDKNGVGTVMRHIPSTILTAEQLNLPPAITRFCHLTKGLVLVTGPTGSGKSTTLAAMVDLINKTRSDHILTIEDPVEFVHQQQKCLVNQREVHKHTGSFSRALKAALREDPDIVLIGEMRDLETVAIAIETAETGHVVFGTLHTNTAVSTIDRIVDQFPTDRQEQIRMMLASSLKGVVAQTLLKKKGGGRVAAHEILVTNDAVSAMIREGKNHMIPNHMQSAKADGNLLLNESLVKLVKEGTVDAEEALKKSIDKNALLDMFKRAGIKHSEPAAPARPGKQSA